MIKHGTFIQVRVYDQRLFGEAPKSAILLQGVPKKELTSLKRHSLVRKQDKSTNRACLKGET